MRDEACIGSVGEYKVYMYLDDLKRIADRELTNRIRELERKISDLQNENATRRNDTGETNPKGYQRTNRVE